MGRLKGLLLIFLAALLAASAGALIFMYLKNRPVTTVRPLDTGRVVVAAQDITYGTRLENEHLLVVDFPRSTVPASAYADVDSVLGQTTKVFIVKGEPVLAPKLSTAGGGLSVRIPETLRAASVKVNEVSGVSGFILPGDRVDMLVTIDNVGRAGNSVTKMILQNLEVLAAGVQQTTKNNKPIEVQAVTLLVDPKGAEDLALALSQGEIHLVLRNPADNAIVKVDPTNTEKVMGRAEPARVAGPVRPRSEPVKIVEKPTPPAKKKTYTIIRNGKVEEEEYPVDKPSGS